MSGTEYLLWIPNIYNTYLKTMKKNYFAPTIIKDDIKVEAGFQVSVDTEWGVGTPGGDINYSDYGTEL